MLRALSPASYATRATAASRRSGVAAKAENAWRIVLPAAALILTGACQHDSPAQPTPPPAACSFTLSSASLSFGAAATSGSVSVSTAPTCAWTAASDRGWMTITSGATGTGPGTVAVSLTANTGGDARSGTLTIAGQPVGVRQDGAQACSIAVAPASAAFGKDAATGTFTVTAADSCTWALASAADWIAIAAGAGGRGTAAVAYSIARNTGAASRTGTIRINEATFSVTQAGDAGTCEYGVLPVTVNACMAAPSELVVSVSTQAACGWTVSTDNPWITLAGAATRSGPGELRFSLGQNYDAPRNGIVKVRWDTPTAGQNVQVAQAGCRYATSIASLNVPADGGASGFEVYQQSDPLECGGPLQNGCVWTASAGAPWITIATAMPKAGDDRVSFTVSSNAGAARSAQITVRDKTVTVLQAGR